MVKVRLHAPRGVGPNGPSGFPEGFNADLTLPAVPRVGETVALGGAYGYETGEEQTYRVHGVHWYPDPSSDFDVYIVLR